MVLMVLFCSSLFFSFVIAVVAYEKMRSVRGGSSRLLLLACFSVSSLFSLDVCFV
jgi:hypothetical protein